MNNLSNKSGFGQMKLENDEKVTCGSYFSIANYPCCEDFVICRPVFD